MGQLKELRGQLSERREALATVFREADAGKDSEGRQVYDLMKASALTGDSGARVEQVQTMNTELEALVDKVKEAEAEQASLAGISAHVDGLGEIVRPAIHSTRGREESPNGQVKSLGQLLVASDAFKGYKPGSRGMGPMSHLDVDLMATLFETAAGWAPESTRIGRVELKPLRPAPHVINAFPEFFTRQAAVKYMEETTHTDNAAEVNEGAVYGEAAFVLTERSQDVEKIGAWLPVTDEQLEDEDEARSYVDNRLMYQLARRVDGQALVGNGTPPNLKGTENVSGIQTQALGTDPIFDAAYKLFRKIRDDGFAEPSDFFIAPSKWETVALTRTSDGLYILGNPQEYKQPRLWGVPGIETTAVTSTKLVAGDYARFAGLYIRKGVDVQVGYQSDDFIKGRLAIRADVRVAVVHFRPKAFGNVTGL